MAASKNPLQNSVHIALEAKEGGSVNFGNLSKREENHKISVQNVEGDVYLSDEEYLELNSLMQIIYNEASKEFSKIMLQFKGDVKNKTYFTSQEEWDIIRKSEKKLKEAAKMAGYEKHELESYFESIGRLPSPQEYQQIIELLQTTPPLSSIKQAREQDFKEYKSFAQDLLKLSAMESEGGNFDDRKDINEEGGISDEEIYKEFPYLAPSLNDDPIKFSVLQKQAELRFESANMIEQDLDEEEEKNKAFQKELLEINDLILELMKVGATPDQINELRERKKKLEEIAMGSQAKAVKKIKDAVTMQMGEASKLVTNMLRNLKGDEKRAFKTFLKEGGMKQISEAPSIGAVKNILSGFAKQVKGKTLAIKIKYMEMDQHFDRQKQNEETKAYKKNMKPSPPLDKYKYEALKKELDKEREKDDKDKNKEKDKKPEEKEKKEEVKTEVPPVPLIGR